MTYKTHLLGGVLAGLILANNIDNVTTVGTIISISSVASLIPDIDIPNSKIGNSAGFVSKGINAAFGHRGLFHAPLLYLLLAFFLQNKVPFIILISALAGIFSHLILDMFNSTGIPIFYPIARGRISIASIRTRSAGETLFAIVLIIAIATLIYLKITNDSLLNLINIIKERG